MSNKAKLYFYLRSYLDKENQPHLIKYKAFTAFIDLMRCGKFSHKAIFAIYLT